MHTVHISERISYPLPSRLDEFNARQLKLFIWILSLNIKSISKAKLLVLLMSLSLPIVKRLRFQFFYFFQASTIERADLLFLTSSFEEFKNFTTQKIKNIRGRFVLLHGPDSGLGNCTFWEFIQAEKYYLNYLNKKELVWLDKLISTLYRISKKDYDKRSDVDRRVALSEAQVKYNMILMHKIDIDTKLAILMWFDNCRNQLVKNFPLVFPKPTETDKSNPVDAIMAGAKKTSRGDWLSLIAELSGSMDHYEKIGQTNILIALTDISHRIKKASEAKSNSKPRK